MTHLSRRQFGKWTALAASAVSLGGCAPWEYADRDHSLDRLIDEPPASRLEWRVLNRLAYGPRPGDVTRLRARGIDAWIDEQLHPESIAESADLLAALDRLETLVLPANEARDRETEWESDTTVAPLIKTIVKVGKPRQPLLGPVSYELAQATVLRAAYSACSLREVMVEFWSDHFNIDQTKGDCRWLKTVDDGQLRASALGRFRDLLGASAHSPAMLFYLDNAQSRKSDPVAGSRLNENYARELLELHTLGNTTAYTLGDIQEVARALSGWAIGDPGTGSDGQFVFRAADHDDNEKFVLGRRIATGGGQRDGEQVLDLLATHPLTARFIAEKLCYRFTGAVPGALRQRLTEVFLASGGDIRQLLAELFTSDEFRHGDQPQFKRPVQFAVSALRMLGAQTSGAGIVPYLESMGQRPFMWVQPDGYPRQTEPWTGGLLARWRFAVDLTCNQIDQTWINLESLERASRDRPMRQICRQLTQSLLAAPPRAADLDALASLGNDPGRVLPQWLTLLLVSPQFQWC